MDYLYGWAYLVTLLVFLESLYTTNKAFNTNKLKMENLIKVSRERGQIILVSILTITPLYALICWIF